MLYEVITMLLAHGSDLPLRGDRAAAGDDGAQTAGGRQRVGNLGLGEQAGLDEILRQTEGDTGTGGNQRHIGAGGANGRWLLGMAASRGRMRRNAARPADCG